VTPLRISIAASVASIVLILVVLELIRGRRLKERYALLWLATGVVLLVLSAWRGALDTIAGWFGVSGYPPAILFAAATLFVIVVLLHYSTVLSQLDDQNTVLAQRVALLERRLEELGEPGLQALEPGGERRHEQRQARDEQRERGQGGLEGEDEGAVLDGDVRGGALGEREGAEPAAEQARRR
jgi:hypothetical protein